VALLRGVGDSVGPPIFLPLQLSDKVRGVRSFESTPREAEAFANKLELG